VPLPSWDDRSAMRGGSDHAHGPLQAPLLRFKGSRRVPDHIRAPLR